MAEIVVFHHIRGLTSGVVEFADQLRAAGHTVHTPDLFEGRTFDSIDEGQVYVQSLAEDELDERAARALSGLSPTVFAGFSLGVMFAQKAAQNHAGARGALLYHSFIPPEYFGGWPDGLVAQIHGAESDPWFEEDAEAAHAFVAAHPDSELISYSGSGHLFADPTDPDFDPTHAARLLTTTLAFVERVGG